MSFGKEEWRIIRTVLPGKRDKSTISNTNKMLLKKAKRKV